jgi:hypothetical protein
MAPLKNNQQDQPRMKYFKSNLKQSFFAYSSSEAAIFFNSVASEEFLRPGGPLRTCGVYEKKISLAKLQQLLSSFRGICKTIQNYFLQKEFEPKEQEMMNSYLFLQNVT